eukprot:Amastigsp_a842174_22.p3 type:complete len:114 gc:universal Amastigsp_a842174_22:840-499(-)
MLVTICALRRLPRPPPTRKGKAASFRLKACHVSMPSGFGCRAFLALRHKISSPKGTFITGQSVALVFMETLRGKLLLQLDLEPACLSTISGFLRVLRSATVSSLSSTTATSMS